MKSSNQGSSTPERKRPQPDTARERALLSGVLGAVTLALVVACIAPSIA